MIKRDTYTYTVNDFISTLWTLDIVDWGDDVWEAFPYKDYLLKLGYRSDSIRDEGCNAIQ